MLEVINISKSFKNYHVLDNISFNIDSGEIVGLVGENGAGKSTLLKILATIDKQDSGSLKLNDMEYAKSKKDIRKSLGFVPQDIAIWEDFSVEENMIFFEKLGWINKSNTELRQICLEMNLNRWKEKVHTLSGGMKRKLNLAISLIHEPNVLLLDEPTVGIDLKSKKEIGSYLKELARSRETAIIYTSHNMDEINELCDRVLCLGNDLFYKNILTKNNKNVVSL